MKTEPKEMILKDGRLAELRSPEKEDAAALLDFLVTAAGETEFILRYPEECTMTVEQEAAWIENMGRQSGTVVIACFLDGLCAGNCQVALIGSGIKNRHRATIAIGIRKAYWGQGIGTAMMREMLTWAEKMGVLQVELEYIEGNARGRALYQKMGFVEYGRRPDAIRLKNGEFRQEILMMKKL